MIIEENFGDPLLFLCHIFLNENHVKPDSWTELFEYARFAKTKDLLKETAMAMAKAEG